MTTQGDFTIGLIEGGEALVRRAEFATQQIGAAVAIFAGERALVGEVTPEHYEAVQKLRLSLGGLAEQVNEGIALVDSVIQSDEEASGNEPVAVAGHVGDVDPGDSGKAENGEANQTEEVDPQARERQEDALTELFGQRNALEIRGLNQDKIRALGEVAATLYEQMDLHPRAVVTRAERVEQIRRYVANGESSAEIAKDFGLTPGAPKTSVNKAIEIMKRDLPRTAIRQLYDSIVNG